jgi:hypothetical protein
MRKNLDSSLKRQYSIIGRILEGIEEQTKKSDLVHSPFLATAVASSLIDWNHTFYP